jgi:hypothetical protein
MSRTNLKSNARIFDKWHGYYLEDTDCRLCRHYRGKKRGCSLSSCCCEDEKLEAIAKGRINRK